MVNYTLIAPPLINRGAHRRNVRRIPGGGYLRAQLQLEAQQPVTLPLSYNWHLQSAIYRALGDYGSKLHAGSPEVLPAYVPVESSSATTTVPQATGTNTLAEASTVASRPYKFFTFSRLLFENRYSIRQDQIYYNSGPIQLVVSSARDEFLMKLAEGMFSGSGLIEVAEQWLKVTDFRLLPHPKIEDFERVKVKTMSPITTRSPVTTPDGTDKDYHYDPSEKEWSGRIVRNLQNKAQRLLDPEALPAADDISRSRVRPLKVATRDLHRSYYKGGRIDAYTGLYQLILPAPLFDVAYNCGLGERNSMGFGMIEVMPHGDRSHGSPVSNGAGRVRRPRGER